MNISTKKELRTKLKLYFDNLSDNEISLKSQEIEKNLFLNKIFCESKIFFIYLSNKKEVQTFNIIERLLKKWKKILVPKVVWKDMYPVEIKDLNLLKRWKYCIEPISEDIYQGEIDIVLVPWMAFNKIWNRLWKWKWFYDRFFKNTPNIYKIWLWFDFQILDQIPTDSWDVDMDLMISD